MLYRYPKREGELDLLDVVDQEVRGWRLKRMCSYGFTRSLHPSERKVHQIVRYARNFIHGDHQPYIVCYPEDDDALHTFRIIELLIRRMAQPVREELSYMSRRQNLSVSIGGIDIRKISAENREETCPRVGLILTARAYEKIFRVDPLAFFKALNYIIPPNFSV